MRNCAQWLNDHGIRTRPFASTAPTGARVILGSAHSAGARRRGGVSRSGPAHRPRLLGCLPLAVRVCQGDQPTAWVPLAKKGGLTALPSWLYHKDEWAKTHPIFDGLPAGGLMDYTFYREIIPDVAWTGQDAPAEVVAGATNTSKDYSAGLTVSVNSLGAGRFILNYTADSREPRAQPGGRPSVAEHASPCRPRPDKPLADLPADFEPQLKAMGYE